MTRIVDSAVAAKLSLDRTRDRKLTSKVSFSGKIGYKDIITNI